jgi:hypothetical protein
MDIQTFDIDDSIRRVKTLIRNFAQSTSIQGIGKLRIEPGLVYMFGTVTTDLLIRWKEKLQLPMRNGRMVMEILYHVHNAG